MTQQQLVKEIKENEPIFTKKHDEILAEIVMHKKKRNRKEKIKRSILYICVILIIVGLTFGHIATRKSNANTRIIQQKIIDKLEYTGS